MLLESIADITTLVEIAQALSPIDFAKKYNLIISNIDLDVVKKLGLTDIKKY